jgi:periplasmic copper chaperone A
VRRTRTILAVGAAVAAVIAGAVPALAHVDLDPPEAFAGSTTLLTFSFRHGKDGTATTELSVQLPDGAEVVSTPPVDGWEAEVTEEDDGLQVVTWSGGSSPDGVDAAFPVEVRLPTEPGEALFPTVQVTEAGELAWISPEEGQGEDVMSAPRLQLEEDPDAPPTTTEPPTTTTERPTTTTIERPTTTAEAEPSTTSTSLPGTTLQAGSDRRGGGALAPWVIVGGIAALVVVVGGGLLLRRRAAS